MQNFTFHFLFFITFSIGLLLVKPAAGQFRGGVNDGLSMSTASNQPLGQNIFRGGNNDGVVLASATAQALGQNIFRGGQNDGFNVSLASTQPLGQNIFRGGLNDGISMSLASTQPLGQNIFRGGVNDGFAVTLGANQALGQNISRGGNNDGWAFAVGNSLVLLPVVLKSFDAAWKNEEDVLCKWITLSENNTDHFEVERSTDGTTFERAGSVPAAGTSSLAITYTFTDLAVNNHYTSYPTQFYYRLKTVDKDGKESYSAIVVLPNKKTIGAEMFVLYPNPAQQYIIVEFKSTANNFRRKRMQLASSDGRILAQQDINEMKQTIQVGKYPSGTYYLRIIDPASGTTQTLKFIIQH